MFPPPPLKFRTVGFPQYGFKLDISHGDLRQSAVLPLAQDPHRHCDTTDLYAITRPPLAPLWSLRTSCRGPLPGRLQSSGPWLTSGFCCPTRSSLTMAASESLGHFRRFMNSYNGSFPCQSYPGSVPRGSPISSAGLSLRADFHTPLDREGALDRFFPSRIGLHQFGNVSASKYSTQSDSTWWLNEAAKFTSCYGPAGLLALHRSGLLLSSFHSLCRHRKRRV